MRFPWRKKKEDDWYDQDLLRTRHNHEFMNDPAFRAAYARGVQAAGTDYQWHWRVHAGLWVAQCAAKVPGDFVECGVGKGFMSSAIMHALNWNALGRTFYLLDTFSGVDERYVTAEEAESGILEKSKHLLEVGFYTSSAEAVIRNFSEWKNVDVIAGPVPETLDRVKAERIAYLHLDMNCAPPEVAALNRFWDRLSPGAPVLLDDYAYYGYRPQKIAMDDVARAKGVAVLALPTGQGLLLKPP
jgi:Macrocin-O-methyltransferase (TylF)